MGLIGKILLAIILIVVGFLAYNGLHAYSLSKVDVIDVRINSLDNVNSKGFTLGGEIDVFNGGMVKADISKITYTIILDETKTQLASGLIDGRKISSKETANFSFSSRISWTPTGELASDLLEPGNSYATLSGNVYLADLGFIELKVPFEKKIDLHEYIEQFVNDKIAETLGENAGNSTTIEQIGNGIKDITGSIIKGIENLFD